MAEYSLDARYLLCPVPVIRTQAKVKELQAGDQLQVTCTDPGAEWDLSSWCKIHGHIILQIEKTDVDLTIKIQVGGTNASTN